MVRRAFFVRGSILDRSGKGGIRFTQLAERPRSYSARVASTAGASGVIRVVARMGEGVVDAQFEPLADDLDFGEMHEGGFDARAVPFDPGAGGPVGHGLEGVDVLGSAVRVARVIKGVDPDVDGAGVDDLGDRQSVAQEDGVSRGDVGHGDLVGAVANARWGGVVGLRHVDVVIGEGGAAEGAEIDLDGAVRACPEGQGDSSRGGEFDGVSLPVGEAEAVARKPLGAGDREARGGVKAAREQHNGGGLAGGHREQDYRAREAGGWSPRGPDPWRVARGSV